MTISQGKLFIKILIKLCFLVIRRLNNIAREREKKKTIISFRKTWPVPKGQTKCKYESHKALSQMSIVLSYQNVTSFAPCTAALWGRKAHILENMSAPCWVGEIVRDRARPELLPGHDNNLRVMVT